MINGTKSLVMVVSLYSAGRVEPLKHCKQVSDVARFPCSNRTLPAVCGSDFRTTGWC